MTFSIIVVCLNAGSRLRDTVESIRRQTEEDYEIIVKDGVSEEKTTTDYLDQLEREGEADSRIRVYRQEKDSGTYDAMNQAVKYCRGDYIFFLNCGDCFYDDQVLAKVREQIECFEKGRKAALKNGQKKNAADLTGADGKISRIFYGNIRERLTGTMVQSNPVIDDFACYRNLPCHQACFYAAELLDKRAFDTGYRVRADYEHFLWCRYRGGAETVYMPVTVALYEGGGFSETRENKRRSKQEHSKITAKYMSGAQILRYRMIMLLTLAPLRTWIAGNPATAGIYQAIKKRLYKV